MPLVAPYRYSVARSMVKVRLGEGLQAFRTVIAVLPSLLSGLALLCCIVATTPVRAQVEKARGLLQTAGARLNADKEVEAGQLAQQAAEAAPQDAGVQMRAGEILFLAGKVAESIPCFDAANKLDPQLAPHNWQRGVALGCLGRFAEGAEQFKTHHDVNPNDVENSAWYFLCVAKTKGRAAAEATVIPSGGDRRQPMMSVLKMLQGTLKPDEVLEAAKMHTNEGQERKMAMFYGFLYVGIYYDSIGDSEKAAAALDKSIEVAQRDYMGRTARLYREIRFPKVPAGPGKVQAAPSK